MSHRLKKTGIFSNSQRKLSDLKGRQHYGMLVAFVWVCLFIERPVTAHAEWPGWHAAQRRNDTRSNRRAFGIQSVIGLVSKFL